ncbi:hypothetical protein FDECE_9851 [Fusarium decemcellulare]|nr:hypothetical protein FDECE_9851 [Fusarium decemcellulare]
MALNTRSRGKAIDELDVERTVIDGPVPDLNDKFHEPASSSNKRNQPCSDSAEKPTNKRHVRHGPSPTRLPMWRLSRGIQKKGRKVAQKQPRSGLVPQTQTTVTPSADAPEAAPLGNSHDDSALEVVASSDTTEVMPSGDALAIGDIPEVAPSGDAPEAAPSGDSHDADDHRASQQEHAKEPAGEKAEAVQQTLAPPSTKPLFETGVVSWKQFSAESRVANQPPPTNVNVPPCTECLNKMIRKPGHNCTKQDPTKKTVKSCENCNTSKKSCGFAIPEGFVEKAKEIALASWRHSVNMPRPENWEELVADYDRVMRIKDPSLMDIKQGMDAVAEDLRKIKVEVDSLGGFFAGRLEALEAKLDGLMEMIKRNGASGGGL